MRATAAVRVIGRDSAGRPVGTRPATALDREFLHEVYASTRQEELAPLGWPPDAVAAFLRQQFDAQDAHYRAHYPGAQYSVVVVEGADAGRVYVYRQPGRLVLMEISLLPEYRGRGAGTLIVRALLKEAAAAGLAVELHVELWNPARRLYERLGFAVTGIEGPYQRMGWRPPVRSRAS